MAARASKGPGSFKEELFDAVYSLNAKTVNRMQKIEEMRGQA
jgi:hydroxyethylthiazole kinase-like sugar kinase family protein